MENFDQLIAVLRDPANLNRQDLLMEAARFCLAQRLFCSADLLIRLSGISGTLKDEFIENLKASVREMKGWPFEFDGCVWLLIRGMENND